MGLLVWFFLLILVMNLVHISRLSLFLPLALIGLLVMVQQMHTEFSRPQYVRDLYLSGVAGIAFYIALLAWKIVIHFR